MKKPVKIIIKVVIALIVLLVALIASSPLWLGPVVKAVANVVAPKYTGTAFNLGQASINPFSLKVEFGSLTLGNPAGFEDPNAVTLGRFNVDVDTASVMSDVLVIEDVSLEDLCVALVKNDKGEGNFEVIGRNATKGGEPAEAKEPAAKPAEAPKAEAASDEGKKPLKLIITRLCVKNLSLKKGVVTIPVPSIELHDLGKDSGGYDVAHMGQAILKEAWASIVASGADVLKLGLDGLNLGGKALIEGAESVKGAAGAAAGAATDAVTGAAGAATDAVTGAAGAATDAVKGAAGAATDAVKGTADALKGLFK